MLVLTRKKGESIKIADNITVVVLGVFGKTVRLGVDAPPLTIVHRGEVADRIRKEAEQKQRERNNRSPDRDTVGSLGRAASELIQKVFKPNKDPRRPVEAR